ncbi:glycosyl transferase group 1 [Ammonifex degensii KC4]|uniref:Glycosyl transferase group 1 n=2 Tax=Ammonifex degensii TaxID=42838 RepID=C9RBN2_AMMDK|nr:glycosyl transferase group 1 [Ammonifex degensii KC4]
MDDVTIRVLILTRPEVFKYFGGEAVQIRETSKALAKLGVSVDVSTDLRPDCSPYDVVHLFNLTMVAETYVQARHAWKQGKPLVLSPIYCTWDEFERLGRRGFLRWINRLLPSVEARQRLKAFAKAFLAENHSAHWLQFVKGYRREQKEILRMVDVILPNCRCEAEAIEREFGRHGAEIQVVPNGVDPLWVEEVSPTPFVDRYGLHDFVLCVGRIDERKNQVALIKALADTGIRLVFIGGLSPRHNAYNREFLELVSRYSNVHYLGQLDHKMVLSAMKAARVHALPSWLETPGLTSLEAGLLGCRIVTTDRGGPPEYFGEMAWYCQPNDLASIRRAVLAAWEAEETPPLREHILANFTWDHAARMTLEGYRKALEKRGFGPSACAGRTLRKDRRETP